MNTMKIGCSSSILLLTVFGSACEQPLAPDAAGAEPAPALASAQASQRFAASGTFTQLAITSSEIRFAGPNVIIEQTLEGSVSGSLAGSVEYRIRVVIHPNGSFTARGTTTCACTVEGRAGVLELTFTDTGEQVSPDTGIFAGRAVITGGTGELAGVRGVFDIEGAVDIPSGLSTFAYSGTIHFRP